jgi:RNA polymerase sigma-70 factor (ECF subfamily)
VDKEIIEIIEKLKCFVRKMIKDEDSVNEIVQNTICKALAKGKLVQNHLGWLITVAKHESYKALKNWQLPLFDHSLATPVDDHEDSIADYMYLLENEQRYLLYMRYFNQFSIKELSKLLKKPEGTLKRKLHEARETLKKEMIMAEKMSPPEVKIDEIKSSGNEELKIIGQGLLMGNPAAPVGDVELIHFYEYPGRVFVYQSETEVAREMELSNTQVVEVINHYKKRAGERERRMYYEVTEEKLEMVMRIFDWEKEGLQVQTDKKEMVKPEKRILKVGKKIKDKTVEIIDRVNLKIGDLIYNECFRRREFCTDYHGKEFTESFFNQEGREVLHRTYIGDNWKMGGYITWEKMEKSPEIEFQGERYRLWIEIVLMKNYQKSN